jgi:hypothetical protein
MAQGTAIGRRWEDAERMDSEAWNNGEVRWELIRCTACGREHTRPCGRLLVLPCVRCGEQPEVYSLRIDARLPVRALGRVGAQLLHRGLGDADAREGKAI